MCSPITFCLPTFVQEVKDFLGSDLEERDGVKTYGECGRDSDGGDGRCKGAVMKDSKYLYKLAE
jgi:hypothetical protein